MRAAILALMLTTASQAAAETFFYDEDLGRDDFKSISVYVQIVDGTLDACWTNLREVTEYAEEKLRSKGFKVTQDSKFMSASRKLYYFYIHVSGRKVFEREDGPCPGTMSVSMSGWNRVNETKHIATIGRQNRDNFVQAPNLNQVVLLSLNKVFLSFPE
jgi:hypothetical protein